MKDLKEIIERSVDEIVDEGSLEQAIKERIRKTLASVYEEELGKYSDFGKSLTAAVKKSIGLNGELELPSYNDAVLEIVRSLVAGQTHAIVQQQVAGQLEELLQPPPAKILFSELVARYVAYCHEEAKYGCRCDDHGQVTVHVVDNEGGYCRIHLDEEPNKSRSECRLSIAVNNRGEVFAINDLYMGKATALFGWNVRGFAKSVFDMRVAGTILEFDRDVADLDLTYRLGDDD